MPPTAPPMIAALFGGLESLAGEVAAGSSRSEEEKKFVGAFLVPVMVRLEVTVLVL